ncbi:MAG TPA: SDR family oxidoreductase [Symbiobacteriaceae bacterium]|nr:SDR family oxidoreductase [Symbiobacteriaceae bacterium]
MRRTSIVTGGTGGIGKATAVALAALGDRVLVVGRNPAKAEAAVSDIRRTTGNEAVELLLCDFGSLASVRSLAAEVLRRYERVHVLVNNAGAFYPTRALTADGFEATFGVNHLAPFLLTNLLLDRLKASAPARIVNVSSAAHAFPGLDFADWQSERGKYRSMRAYAMSKIANILCTYELARRLAGTGVTANCLHPGMVGTDIFTSQGKSLAATLTAPLLRPFMLTPAQGAETSVYLAADPAVEGVTGRYYANRRERRSSRRTYDEALARKLWALSERMTAG